MVNASKPDFDPPLPRLYKASLCAVDEFAFNVNVLNKLVLTSLCVREDLRICLPYGSNGSKGFKERNDDLVIIVTLDWMVAVVVE